MVAGSGIAAGDKNLTRRSIPGVEVLLGIPRTEGIEASAGKRADEREASDDPQLGSRAGFHERNIVHAGIVLRIVVLQDHPVRRHVHRVVDEVPIRWLAVQGCGAEIVDREEITSADLIPFGLFDSIVVHIADLAIEKHRDGRVGYR
jgi:hypothetical protein